MNADEIIFELNRFEADNSYDENQSRLYPILDDFRSMPDQDKWRVIDAMFALIERFPNAYFGSPGPIVHSIESMKIGRTLLYEYQLLESIHRQPTDLNVWMLNRILNTPMDTSHRNELMDVLKAVPAHPRVSKDVAKKALGFLTFQIDKKSI